MLTLGGVIFRCNDADVANAFAASMFVIVTLFGTLGSGLLVVMSVVSTAVIVSELDPKFNGRE